jgi:hypothetical protein
VRAGAEDPVHPARGVAPTLEHELQRRHIPSAVALLHYPRAEAGTAEPAERAARLRSGDAVDEQVAATLEGDDPALRERALHPIDGDGIEAD